MNINTPSITLKTFESFFKSLIDMDSPAYMVGAPGAGKSTVVETLGKKYGYNVVTIMLGQTQPGDLGIPTVRPKHPEFVDAPPQVLEWAIAKWLVELDPTKPTLIFLDELDKASPDIVSQVLDLLLNKTILGQKLPPQTRIIAAGNRAEDQSNSQTMGRATVDRLIVFQIHTDTGEWLEWGVANNVHPAVLSYIHSHAISLTNTTANEDMITPSPRSWAGKVSALLHLLAPVGTNQPIEVYNNALPILSGIVGESTAKNFLNFLEDSVVLPTMPALLKMNSKELKKLEISQISHIYTLGYNAVSYSNGKDVNTLLTLFSNILEILDNSFDGKQSHSESEQMLFLLLAPICAANKLPDGRSWYTALQNHSLLPRIRANSHFNSNLQLSDLEQIK